jgi:hypothetical protein
MNGNGHDHPPSFEDKIVELGDHAQREVRLAAERCSIELQEADARLKSTLANALQETVDAQTRSRERLQRVLRAHVPEDLSERILSVGTEDRPRGLRLIARVKLDVLKSAQASATPAE